MDKPVSKKTRNITRIIHYEKELKAILRQRLDRVEKGLVAADGGRERAVATGKIDITARDVGGNYVVIELKVGPCPVGAMEQVLGYASDLEAETGTPCRAVIIASEFSERLRAAARRAHELYLVNYVLEDMGFEEGALLKKKTFAVLPKHRLVPRSTPRAA
jgi:RecB family endonuclease NucS